MLKPHNDAAVADAETMAARARALETALGILRTKHLEDASRLANVNWPAVRAALPNDLVMDRKARMMVSPSQKAAHRLEQAAKTAVAALNNTNFHDETPGPRDTDPRGMRRTVQALLALVAGGVYRVAVHEDTGERIFIPSAAHQRALAHAKHFLALGEKIVESARDAVRRFRDAEAAAADVLNNLAPGTPTPVAPRQVLPELRPAPRAASASSYQDFEARESMRDPQPPVDRVRVEVVGDNDGYRVGGR